MLTDVALKEAAEAALAELARGCRNSMGVADRLEKAGIRGARENCLTCPVANWLLVKLPPGCWVRVYDDGSASVGQDEEDANGITVDLPPVVADFIDAHDHGAYPQLCPQGV